MLTALNPFSQLDRYFDQVMDDVMGRPIGAAAISSNFEPHVDVRATDAEVTCKACCAKQGTAAPTARGKVARDSFEVGQIIKTSWGQGKIVKLTASLVTYTVEGEKGNFAARRADLRRLNG